MKKKDGKVVVKLKKEYLSSEKKFLKYKAIICVLSVFLGVSFVFVVLLSFRVSNYASSSAASASSKIATIKDYFMNNWLYGNNYEDLDKTLDEKMFYGMSQFDEDPYTTYMSPVEMGDFSSSINKIQLGIGVSYYSEYNGYPLIREVYLHSGAYDAGMKKDDHIISIDGYDAYNISSEKIKELVLGDEHTFVNIVVERNGEKISLNCERKEFDSTANVRLIDDVVFLTISSFGDQTVSLIDDLLSEYTAYNKLVIDVRDNSGGYQTALLEIAGLFLPNDTIVMKELNKNGITNIFASKYSKQYNNFDKISIITNENTASAAEVFAICMKEQHKNTTLVGTQTYGKGVVQSNFYLEDGSYLKITTSYWTSPNDVSLKDGGIIPDILVNLDDAYYINNYAFNDTDVFELNSVSLYVENAQRILNFLGYDINRFDGYFDNEFSKALNQFKSSVGLSQNSKLDKETYEKILDKFLTSDTDAQVKKALEVVNG